MPDGRFAHLTTTTPRPMPAVHTPSIKLLAHDRRQAQSPACFRSDERLWCVDAECVWRQQCRRLVAVWKR